MSVYVQSLLWLAGFGGLGYALLKLTPNEQRIQQLKETNKEHRSEELRKKQQVIDKLREATVSKPIYLSKPVEGNLNNKKD